MGTIQGTNSPANTRRPWNKGKLVGPKPPLLAETRLGDPHQAANPTQAA